MSRNATEAQVRLSDQIAAQLRECGFDVAVENGAAVVELEGASPLLRVEALPTPSATWVHVRYLSGEHGGDVMVAPERAVTAVEKFVDSWRRGTSLGATAVEISNAGVK